MTTATMAFIGKLTTLRGELRIHRFVGRSNRIGGEIFGYAIIAASSKPRTKGRMSSERRTPSRIRIS